MDAKRIIDFLIAAGCLIIFSPLFLICYIAVKWEDGGPAFYQQERIGLHGKPFFIYKFRSMRVDAETSTNCPNYGMCSKAIWRLLVPVLNGNTISTRLFNAIQDIRSYIRYVLE